MYSVNFVISLSLSIILLPTVIKFYKDKMCQEKGFFEDPARVQWLTAASLACVYILVDFATDIYFLVTNWNIFIFLKFIFSFILAICVIISLICWKICCKKTNDDCDITNVIFKFCLVSIVWLAIFLLSLSIVPTVLLLCAYPMDTFALIVIHVALIYTETEIGTFVIMQLFLILPQKRDESWPKWMCLLCSLCCQSRANNGNPPSPDDSEGLVANGQQHCKCCSYNTKHGCVCRLVSITIILPILIVFNISVYCTFIWFYQFILLRSVNSNVAFDIILKYIPSVVIGLIGFFIRKETFKDKKKKITNK